MLLFFDLKLQKAQPVTMPHVHPALTAAQVLPLFRSGEAKLAQAPFIQVRWGTHLQCANPGVKCPSLDAATSGAIWYLGRAPPHQGDAVTIVMRHRLVPVCLLVLTTLGVGRIGIRVLLATHVLIKVTWRWGFDSRAAH